MNPPADPALIGLFLLIYRLHQNDQPLGRGTILPLAEIKLPRVAQRYDALICELLEGGLIQGNAESFILSPEGSKIASELSGKHSLHTLFYNEYYQAITHSQAHHLFCERVYGMDLGQHGMADREQIEALLLGLQIEAGMSLLDFGCGDGQIAEYIAGTTRTRITGVDLSDGAIRLARLRTQDRRGQVQFHVADREGRLEFLSGASFDRIMAIDSLFFVPDVQAVTERFLELLKPGGRMGVFYISPPLIEADGTPFAEALAGLGLPYRVEDLSLQNAIHWQKKKQALLELEERFRAEGNDFLFRNRLAECDGLEQFHRYLYIVEAGQ